MENDVAHARINSSLTKAMPLVSCLTEEHNVDQSSKNLPAHFSEVHVFKNQIYSVFPLATGLNFAKQLDNVT